MGEPRAERQARVRFVREDGEEDGGDADYLGAYMD
jgi:hypothetical protein